jgi:hypothetical protein
LSRSCPRPHPLPLVTRTTNNTTFWLVVADQFAKRAITCDRAREQALTIIDAGSDLAMHAALGMSPADLAKRRKLLQRRPVYPSGQVGQPISDDSGNRPGALELIASS